MKVTFTNEVIELFKDLGVFNSKLLSDLSETVTNKISRGEHKIDTSDTMLSVSGRNISFIRDWENGNAIILTNNEAHRLDMADAFRNDRLF